MNPHVTLAAPPCFLYLLLFSMNAQLKAKDKTPQRSLARAARSRMAKWDTRAVYQLTGLLGRHGQGPGEGKGKLALASNSYSMSYLNNPEGLRASVQRVVRMPSVQFCGCLCLSNMLRQENAGREELKRTFWCSPGGWQHSEKKLPPSLPLPPLGKGTSLKSLGIHHPLTKIHS